MIRTSFLIAVACLVAIGISGVSNAEGSQAPTGNAQNPASPSRYFEIHVIDEQTGRGVPMVNLRTVSNLSFWTDSNGLIALDEPGLMGQRVFFVVESDGYEFPKDGFGYRGRALDVAPGKSATLRIKRLNVAERLYRVTGEGIYRDTILLGKEAPIRHPLLDAKVVGQDSVQDIVYRGKIHWFFGDTAWPAYPLGQFGMSGATSDLPQKGGLDPSVGVNLKYFVGSNGFSRPMVDMPGPGAKWADGLMILNDAKGQRRLFANVVRLPGLKGIYERALLEYDDAKAVFKPVAHYDLHSPFHPSGHAFHYTDAGVDYLYFPIPFPVLRVKADLKSVEDQSSYEAFTCLRPGSHFDKSGGTLDRANDGSLNWFWKRNTWPTSPGQEQKLIAAGKMKPNESRFLLHDPATHRTLVMHGGSVYYNNYRKCWIMIAVEAGGQTSYLGDVWYAEAPSPIGPWYWARKIVTHNKYSFYNPAQHPFFDQQGGRIIYFEGTYASTFSGNDQITPLYDYNQIMYRLDLSDPRLKMPPPPTKTNIPHVP